MKLSRLFLVGIAASSFLFGVHRACANVGESLGFGSRTAALAGASGVTGGFDAYTAYHNPAGLSLGNSKRLLFNYGLVYMQPSFRSITGVLVQNNFTADGDTVGAVDTAYKATLGSSIGMSYQVFPEVANFTVGVTGFIPVSQLAYMDSGEAYVPEYILYRARTQRPQLELGVGADLGRGLHLGLGLHMGFSLTSNSSVFINTKTSTASSMRFTSTITPKFAPFFGVLYTPVSSFSFGSVFRLPVVSDNTMALKSSARVFGDFAAVDFNFTAVSALFYDPMAIELGGNWVLSEKIQIFGQVDYQFWSAFQAPALLIQQPQTTNCSGAGCPSSGTLNIAGGSVPAFQYVNVLVPRLGTEYKMSAQTTFRFGYAYRRSILSSPPNDGGNFLDPTKHMLNLGLGLKFQHILSVEVPCEVNFNLAFHYLELQSISKTAGNEVGDMTDSKIGAPGYNAGGNLYGGGVSLSLAL